MRPALAGGRSERGERTTRKAGNHSELPSARWFRGGHRLSPRVSSSPPPVASPSGLCLLLAFSLFLTPSLASFGDALVDFYARREVSIRAGVASALTPFSFFHSPGPSAVAHALSPPCVAASQRIPSLVVSPPPSSARRPAAASAPWGTPAACLTSSGARRRRRRGGAAAKRPSLDRRLARRFPVSILSPSVRRTRSSEACLAFLLLTATAQRPQSVAPASASTGQPRPCAGSLRASAQQVEALRAPLPGRSALLSDARRAPASTASPFPDPKAAAPAASSTALRMIWGYPVFGDDPKKLRRKPVDHAWERGLRRANLAWEYETANRLAQGIYYIKEEHSIHTIEEEGLGTTDDMMMTAEQAAGNVEIDPEEVEKIKRILPTVDRGDGVGIATLIGAKDGMFAFRYNGPLTHKFGFKQWLRYLITANYPGAKVRLVTEHTIDPEDRPGNQKHRLSDEVLAQTRKTVFWRRPYHYENQQEAYGPNPVGHVPSPQQIR